MLIPHDRRRLDEYLFERRLRADRFPLLIEVAGDEVNIFLKGRKISPGEIEIQDGMFDEVHRRLIVKVGSRRRFIPVSLKPGRPLTVRIHDADARPVKTLLL